MALLTFLPADPSSHDLKKHAPNSKRKKKQQQQIKTQKQQQPSSSWDQIKNLLTCKQIEDSKIHDPSRNNNNNNIYTSCSSICTFRDVVHGNTRVVHRADNSPESSTLGQETRLLSKKSNHGSSSRSINSSSVRSGAGGAPYTGRGMQLRKLSGCYECHAIVDPSSVRVGARGFEPQHSRNNLQIKLAQKDNPICKIERILKVHNTQRTIQRFEDYRDAVKTRATSNAKRNARCAADGNELLRFHCATLTCSLGARGSSSLCGSIPACGATESTESTPPPAVDAPTIRSADRARAARCSCAA
ncbi:hypothetical protein DH2020_034980 [Rehmannia glutinosa]|uniref:Uncharacterized protein n=1 Tax=Rehmannia glutinosa TaxID=99300 RepID=A0ABR0V7U9_REHGL